MNEVVWIRTSVEMGPDESVEYMSVPLDEWESMTEDQQEKFIVEVAVTHQNNVAPCGGDVVDESEVPDWAQR